MKEEHGLIFDAAMIREKGGLTVKRTLVPGLFAGVLDSPAEVTKAAADLIFSVGGESILLLGAAQASLRMECARCGGFFTTQFSETFDEVYEDAVQSIDVSFPLTEAVALMMPLKPLCGPACRGLCLTCGENLNLRACGCGAAHGAQPAENGKENPFRALKGIIKKND